MLSTKIQDAFNKQLNAEFCSAYLYLSMSGWFETNNLTGMAQWMRLQAQEELQHALKFFDFIHNRRGTAELTPVEVPVGSWNSPLDVFEATMEHEQKITGLIHQLVDLSLSEKDHAANTFLQWFVTEQVEEEATVMSIVDKLKLVGDNGVALFMLDAELGQRTPSPGANA